MFLRFILLLLFINLPFYAKDNPLIAIMGFNCSGVEDSERIDFENMVRMELRQSDNYELVSPEKVDTHLRKLGIKNCANVKCALKEGATLGTQEVGFGNLEKKAGRYNFSFTIMEVKSGRMKEEIITGFSEPTYSDKVVLRNGNILENVKTTVKYSSVDITAKDGKVTTYRKQEIKSIKLNASKINRVIYNDYPKTKDIFKSKLSSKLESLDEDYDKNEIKMQESHYGIGAMSPFIAYNNESEEKYLQVNFLYGKAKNVNGASLNLFPIGGNHIKKNITGLQLNFTGTNIVERKIDMGVQIQIVGLNFAHKNCIGFQGTGIGLNKANNDLSGVQFSMGANYVGGKVTGAQVNAFFNNAKDVKGLQFVAVGANTVDNDASGTQIVGIGTNVVHGNLVSGVQFSWANSVNKTSDGVLLAVYNQAGQNSNIQVGAVNSSQEAEKGIQMGILNFSAGKSRFQFGLLNISLKNKIPVMPFVNYDF
jgi:hypothetical protein